MVRLRVSVGGSVDGLKIRLGEVAARRPGSERVMRGLAVSACEEKSDEMPERQGQDASWRSNIDRGSY